MSQRQLMHPEQTDQRRPRLSILYDRKPRRLCHVVLSSEMPICHTIFIVKYHYVLLIIKKEIKTYNYN